MSNYSEVGLLPSGAQMGRLIDAVEAIANGSGGSQIKSSIEYGIRFALGEDGKLASTPAGERVIRYNGAITTWDIDFIPNVGDGTSVTTYNDNPFDLIDLFSPPLWVDGLGNQFRRFSPFYYGEQKMGGYLYFWVCKTKLYSFYRLPQAFQRTINGVKYVGYRDIAVYEGSEKTSNEVTYLASATNEIPSYNRNRTQFQNFALANGTILNIDTDEECYGITHMSEYTEIFDYLIPIIFGTLNSQNSTSGFVGPTQFSWTYVVPAGMPVAAYDESTMTLYFTSNPVPNHYKVNGMICINTNNTSDNSYYFQILSTGTATGTVSGTTFTPTDDGETYYYLKLDGSSFPAPPTVAYLRPLKTGETDVIDSTNGTLAQNGICSFKIMGIENLWGNMNTQILDLSVYNYTPYQLKDSYNFTEFSTGNYQTYYNAASYQVPALSGNGQYITEMGSDDALPAVKLPIASTGGNSNTYYCDMVYTNSGAMTAYFGGDLYGYSNDGVFSRDLYYGVGDSDFNCGARLFHWKKIGPLQGD